MEQLKISKLTKQQIALNYAIKKLSDREEDVIKEIKFCIASIIPTFLKINHTKTEEFEILLEQINNNTDENIKREFYSSSINFHGFLNATPMTVESFKYQITSNGIFTYLCNNEQNSLFVENKTKITKDNFNYRLFNNDLIFEDDVFLFCFEKANTIYEAYIKDLNTAYENCYELIRSIRTLDRIEKKFPDVKLYLPEEIEQNEDKVSINEKFKSL